MHARLHELQARFSEAICTQVEEERPKPSVQSDNVDWGTGLEVYRNNFRVGAEAALGNIYPVVKRLVAPEYFAYLCRTYTDRHPMSSGNVDDHSIQFPVYLKRTLLANSHPYIPDIAELEFARYRAATAADAESASARLMTDISTDFRGELQLRLHPSLSLISSEYPILSIWRENQKPDDEIETVELNSPVDYLMIYRFCNQVQMRRCSRHEFLFLQRIFANRAFSITESTGVDGDDSHDIEKLLIFLFRYDLVTGYRLGGKANRITD